MSTLMKVIAYALITLFLGALLKELGFKGAKLVIILGTVSVICSAIISAGEIFASIKGMDSEREYVVTMLKMIGVGYISGICSDICSDLGENSLSSAVCLFGRVEIVTLSLPYIKRIVERGMEML